MKRPRKRELQRLRLPHVGERQAHRVGAAARRHRRPQRRRLDPVERVNGRLELRTGDGSIRASDVGGELILNTGDGSVTVDGADGQLALETGDGGVNVAGKLTAVKLHTGDGSIVYRAEPGARDGRRLGHHDRRRRCPLYLPPGFGAELDAHTGDGAIRNELDVADLEKSATADATRPRQNARCAGGSATAAGSAHPHRRRRDYALKAR